MATIFCPSCGHANVDDDAFCHSCGTALNRPKEPIGGREAPGSTTSSFAVSESGPAGAEESELPANLGDLAATLPAGSAMLIVVHGPNTGSRFLLDKPETSVGRHPDSDVFLDDVTVSRRHAVFLHSDSGGGFMVRDVGSLNGTYLHRERVDEASVTHGDQVQIGKFRLVFVVSSQ
jgi:hypothetical protein